MSDDYLWDGSGEPDPDVQKLEQTLAPLRHDAPLQLPAAKPKRWGMYAAVAAAAVLLIVAGALLLRPERDRQFAQLPPDPPEPPPHRCVDAPVDQSWAIQRFEGTPSCGNAQLDQRSARLPVGECFETDARSKGTLQVAKLGVVNVGANTKICLKHAKRTHRLQLAKGSIHAKIDAPPRLFFVETKSATAVDLGCEYTLKVDEHGAGVLHVTLGFVSFERDGREAMVPAGNLAETHPRYGPGTPYTQSAPPALRKALREFDFGATRGTDAALAELLPHIVDSDSITLWHLLTRTTPNQRKRVLVRLQKVEKLPPTVKQADIIAGKRKALEAYRKVLQPLW